MHRLRSLMVCGSIDPDLQVQIELKSQNLPNFERDKLPAMKSVFTQFGPNMHLSTVKIPIDSRLG